MKEREKEAHDIMYSLFDQEEIQKRHWRAEGKVEGRAEGKAEMIKNMLSIGIPIDNIIKVSGWSKNQILKPVLHQTAKCSQLFVTRLYSFSPILERARSTVSCGV